MDQPAPASASMARDGQRQTAQNAAMSMELAAVLVNGAALLFVWRTLHVYGGQLGEMKRATDLSALTRAIYILQSPEQRRARGDLYALGPGERVPTNAEYAALADEVAPTWSVVSILVLAGLIPEQMFLDNWRSMTVRSYSACRPWIEHRRDDEDNAELWRAFSDLAAKAGYVDAP